MKDGLTILVIILSLSSIGQTTWPTKSWPTGTPASVNLNADSLAAFDKDIAGGKYGYVDGLLVIRHGKIVFDRSYQHDYASIYNKEANTYSLLNPKDKNGPYNYFNPWWHPFFHRTNLHSMQSVTKTITSVIIGTALTRKEFPDINTPVLKFFDTTDVQNIDDRKRRMTIRDLLTMTAGFNWNESLPYTDTNNNGTMMEAGHDWVRYTINRPMSDEPGSIFNYNSGGTMVLAHVFNEATGFDLEEYAMIHLFEPLGIKNYYWKRSPSGVADAEGGLYLDIHDLAKIFYLYLHEGKWDGKQIVSAEWVKQSVTSNKTLGANTAYGYKWWISKYDNNSRTAWNGNGFGGQFPIILPEFDMIIVVTAWNVTPGKPFLNHRVAIERVFRSITDR